MIQRIRNSWTHDTKAVALVSTAHFISHYHLLLLPPVFELVRTEYGASYGEIALALTVFNVVSAVLQAPAGFVVDRLGGRSMLTAGLLLATAAIAAAALLPSYWMLLVAYGFLGLANTVYHPADYSILSATVKS